MWTSGPSRPISYGFPPEMGMLGLRDVFLVAPATDPYQHHHHLHPHHHHHHHHHSSVNETSGSNPGKALGFGVIPLLPTAVPNMNDNGDDLGRNNPNSGAGGGGGGGGIQLWQQNQQQQIQHHPIFFKKNHDHLQLQGSGAQLAVQGGGSASSSSSALTCQDCGNQAKKDCSHRRCRTCCKSRGFDCATHVKSTWVPAARRRERQLMSDSAVAGAGAASSASTNTTNNNNNTNNGSCKKPRLIGAGAGSQNSTPSNSTYSNNTTPPRSYETTTSKHQDGGVKDLMPGQVRAAAVFKCVRVTAVDEGAEDEYAYQAVVKIGGHVFKGFLYDQGVEGRDRGASSSSSSFPNFSDLHLGGGGASTSGRNGGAPILDAADDVYAAASAAAASGAGLLLGGSNFGNPMN